MWVFPVSPLVSPIQMGNKVGGIFFTLETFAGQRGEAA